VATKYKQPDLNAPRYRPKKLNLTNSNVYNQFVQENPRFSSLTATQFKEVISSFNGKIWNKVIESRDGVELPEQLGYLFIGTCPRKQGDNPDFRKSNQYGKKIQNQNWESDQYVAKIFYTNFETKYRFKHHEMWGFTGLRDFKRTVAKTYPQEWKKYVQVDNLVKVSLLFRKHKFKDFKKNETQKLLEEYDEFNLD
jgi:hypothetical protein